MREALPRPPRPPLADPARARLRHRREATRLPGNRGRPHLRGDLHLGRRRLRASPRAPRRARDLGTHGTPARRPRRAPPVGVPALRVGEPAGVSQRPRGLADLAPSDAVFTALPPRSRRTILTVLHARGGQMTSGAIAARFDCSWPTTSQHLRVLEKAGLVTIAMHGRERIYRLETGPLHSVAGAWLDRLD